MTDILISLDRLVPELKAVFCSVGAEPAPLLRIFAVTASLILHNWCSTGIEPASPVFNQLHNSLNGGSAGQGGIDDVPAPAPPALLVDALLVDAEPLADAEPLRPP